MQVAASSREVKNRRLQESSVFGKEDVARMHLIALSDRLYAVSHAPELPSGTIAVGTLGDARAYLEDVVGIRPYEIDYALVEMKAANHNCAHFGVVNGFFLFTTKTAVPAELKARLA